MIYDEIDYQEMINELEDELRELEQKVCRLENHIIATDKENERLREELQRKARE